MKFYKSMFSIIYFWTTISLWGIGITLYCFLINGIIPPYKDIPVFLIIIFLVIIGIIQMVRSTYYIVVYEKGFTIKNAFCPFIEESFMYENIKHIECTIKTRHLVLKIYQKEGYSQSYLLKCVREKDYPSIIEMLQKKGAELKKK